ncbi:MAG: hypothetical protein V2A61_03200 [Calditrichota bacterium]
MKLIWVARIITLLWAGFWVWFGLASGIGEGLSFGGILLHAVMPGLVWLALALAVWRWPKVVGGLLIFAGLAVLVGYPMSFGSRFPLLTIICVELTMALPPLLSGILLVIAKSKDDKKGKEAKSPSS